MKKLLLIPLSLLSSSAFALYENVVNCTGLSQTVNANNSSAIQACLNQAATLSSTINLPAGTYFISGAAPLQPLSSTRFRGNNTDIKVIPNNLGVYQAILISGKTDVVIENINLVGDKMLHTNTGDEAGMGVYIKNSSNITLRNVKASQFWGDGFYVGAPRSTNVNLLDVVANSNRRQGLTVTAVNGMYVRGKFINTGAGLGTTCTASLAATPPCAGIDAEPNNTIDSSTGLLTKIQGLTIENSDVSDNLGAGIEFLAQNAGQISNTVSDVTVRGNMVFNNYKHGVYLSANANNIKVYGNSIISNKSASTGLTLEGASNNQIYGNTFGRFLTGSATTVAVSTSAFGAPNANNAISYNSTFGYTSNFIWYQTGTPNGVTLTANTIKP